MKIKDLSQNQEPTKEHQARSIVFVQLIRNPRCSMEHIEGGVGFEHFQRTFNSKDRVRQKFVKCLCYRGPVQLGPYIPSHASQTQSWLTPEVRDVD